MSPASVDVPAGRLITDGVVGLLQVVNALFIAADVAPALRVVQMVLLMG